MQRATQVRGTLRARHSAHGFTLIELVITVTVLAILTLGVIPLVKVSVQRQKEEQLRAALREIREAIDQFHREALAGGQMQLPGSRPIPGGEPGSARTQPPAPSAILTDPRVRVFITDQTIFGVDNPDRYPPDLETLVNGVDVLPLNTSSLTGGRGDPGVNATDVGQGQIIPKTKIYLRRIPIDPMTGKADWCLRSSYDEAGTSCDGSSGENVFDVRSRSEGEPLNKIGKYSDW